jgi:molybdopterin-guanine dinucleotide biosynthesis protein A
MRAPGFVTSLKEELSQVMPVFKARVHRAGGLTDEELVRLVQRIDPAPLWPDHPTNSAISHADVNVTLADETLGQRLIAEGKVAFVVLAGGAGTRMGGPKVFAKLPSLGLSLLGWKLLQAGNMPVWVMTTPDMTSQVQRHISTLAVPMGMNGAIFEQFEGYRLTPDNRLSLLAPGIPNLYPLGHGDVGPALIESGVLADNPGVEHVVICNVDNVMACPHLGIIGQHVRSQKRVTCEVVERKKGDTGGVLAWVDNRLQVVEAFRLPSEFVEVAPFLNTNTMIINVEALRKPIDWRWHHVRKQAGTALVVQHERLLQQYTEEFETNYVEVPREARYCPVKTADDLEHADELLASYRFQ